MILAVDTYYQGSIARTSGLIIDDWQSEHPSEIFNNTFTVDEDYVPGEFFRRELPCILDLLKEIDPTKYELIIVDGYVILDAEGKKGLGGYLHEALDVKVPIIGVAKNPYHQVDSFATKILRGDSSKALYITSVGIQQDVAAERIKSMHGEHRIPTILKQVDHLSRAEP